MGNNTRKGFSIIELVIVIIIIGIIGGILTGAYFKNVKNSKIATIQSHIKSQASLLGSEVVLFNEEYLVDNDGDNDYLDDLIADGRSDQLPLNIFEDESRLTWELRKIVEDGKDKLYYLEIESTNELDQSLIQERVDNINFTTRTKYIRDTDEEESGEEESGGGPMRL